MIAVEYYYEANIITISAFVIKSGRCGLFVKTQKCHKKRCYDDSNTEFGVIEVLCWITVSLLDFTTIRTNKCTASENGHSSSSI